MLEEECCGSCQGLVAMRLTYDACIVPEQEARSTDEEAEEVGSEGTKPRARKLRHGSIETELSQRRQDPVLYRKSRWATARSKSKV